MSGRTKPWQNSGRIFPESSEKGPNFATVLLPLTFSLWMHWKNRLFTFFYSEMAEKSWSHFETNLIKREKNIIFTRDQICSASTDILPNSCRIFLKRVGNTGSLWFWEVFGQPDATVPFAFSWKFAYWHHASSRWIFATFQTSIVHMYRETEILGMVRKMRQSLNVD